MGIRWTVKGQTVYNIELNDQMGCISAWKPLKTNDQKFFDIKRFVKQEMRMKDLKNGKSGESVIQQKSNDRHCYFSNIFKWNGQFQMCFEHACELDFGLYRQVSKVWPLKSGNTWNAKYHITKFRVFWYNQNIRL